MSIDISVGFNSPPHCTEFPGYDIGGIRLEVDGDILTQLTNEYCGAANYAANGKEIIDTTQYIGEYLSFILQDFTEAIVRFQTGTVDRYEAIPIEIMEGTEFCCIVVSFCDGNNVRLAVQPTTPEYREYFPLQSTVGYAVNPDAVCQELIGCFEQCVEFAERVHVEYDNIPGELAVATDWATTHIQQLEDAIDSPT